jgi:hypothetical protein
MHLLLSWKSMSLRVIVVLTLLLAPHAEADDGVLIAHVPRGAQRDVVISVIKQAFVSRRWTVDSVEEGSVSASISRSNIGVRIKVFIVDRTLLYEGNAETRAPPGGNPSQPRTHRVPRPLPENWIENLRQDIGRMLATIPDH